MSTNVIRAYAWDAYIGAVALDPPSGHYVFEYEPAWRRRGIELAPLTMPTGSAERVWAFPGLGESFHRLPGLLADALPDDFGNRLIDAWMLNHGVDRASITPLDRLAYMGKRGLGALEFRPPRGQARESARPLEMKALVEGARQVLHGDLTGGDATQAALINIIRVGTSAGGARAKAVIAWNPRTDEMRSGQFEVADGFEHWLLKFDGVGRDLELGAGRDYGKIEYAYHRMAGLAGVEMAPCRLLREHERAHFMTRRFDRDGNRKHHVQTLCALMHLDYRQRATHAYEQYFHAMKRLGLDDAALEQGFRRMAFNVMARNCDDHTKNFAFRLREGAAWELAPAYDVTHAYNPSGEWTHQHLMSVNGKFADIDREDLLVVARRFAIPRAPETLERVRGALDSWEELARDAGIAAGEIGRIRRDFQPM